MPAKDATTLYLPVMSGVQRKLYAPVESVVVVPMFRKLPFESVTSIEMMTPVKLLGSGFCL